MRDIYYGNLPTCYHEIFVKKRSDKTFMPACETSRKFAKLIGVSILTPYKLSMIESMGYVVEIDKTNERK